MFYHREQNLLLSKMAENKSLKCFEMHGPTMEFDAFRGVAVLLEAKQAKQQFKLAVNLNYIPSETANLNLDVLQRFVYSVANSSSSISLLIVSDLAIRKIVQVTPEQEIVDKFLARVEWIVLLNFNNVELIMNLLQRNRFPNLKRFDEGFPHNSWETVEISDVCSFSEKLEELSVRSRNFLKQPLPQFLKYLHIQGGVRWTLADIQDAVEAISDGCPLLDVLKLEWNCSVVAPNEDEINKVRLQNKKLFPSKFCKIK